MRTCYFALLALSLFLVALIPAACGVPPSPASPTQAPALPASAATLPATALPAASPTSALDFPAPLFTLNQGRILFSVETPLRNTLVYIDSKGLHVIPTADDHTLGHAVWSGPDTLIFDSEKDGKRHLYAMTLDGAVTQITSGNNWEGYASVSPNGKYIAYENWTDANQDLGLKVSAIDGSGVRNLTPAGEPGAPGGDRFPIFSPDGKWMAFVRVASFDQKLGGIFIMRPDGSDLHRLTPDEQNAGYPRWSPDGTKILYSVNYPDGPLAGALWVVPVNGGEPVQLAGTSEYPTGDWAFEGDWSPDGTRIVYKYFHYGWDHNELRLADADGTHVSTLWVMPNRGAETPDWGG
jgi:TolB protein